MKTSEILYKAAHLMEEKGRRIGECWDGETNNTVDSNGHLHAANYQGNGSVCLIGAIGAVQGMSYAQCFDRTETIEYVETYLLNEQYIRFRHDKARAVYSWNDHEAQSDEEVLTVLRNAAGKAQADGR